MKLCLSALNDFVLLEKIITKKEEKKGVIILPNSTEEVTYIVKSIGEKVTVDIGIGNKLLLSDMHEELPVDKKYGESLVFVKQDVIIAYEYTVSEKQTKEKTDE